MKQNKKEFIQPFNMMLNQIARFRIVSKKHGYTGKSE